MINIYDFHSHILPGIDDGCVNVAQSLDALCKSAAQGVRTICLTPHYYPVETVNEFLSRRQTAMDTLTAAISQEKEDFPQLCLGAEVAYHPGLSVLDDLEELRLGNSRYLLLELPFQRWGPEIIRDIRNIFNTRGVIPILAHIERYLPFQKKSTMNEILNQDVLIQMNGEFLLNWATRGKAKSMIKNGAVHLLGSDCHNLTDRAPNLGEAVAYLQKGSVASYLPDFIGFQEEIIAQICGD